jgi:hypothetical protein
MATFNAKTITGMLKKVDFGKQNTLILKRE